MLTWILNLLFGCRHKNVSFPITPRRGQPKPEAANLTGVYVSCLKCGKEFAYDWSALKIVTPRQWRKQHGCKYAQQ